MVSGSHLLPVSVMPMPVRTAVMEVVVTESESFLRSPCIQQRTVTLRWWGPDAMECAKSALRRSRTCDHGLSLGAGSTTLSAGEFAAIVRMGHGLRVAGGPNAAWREYGANNGSRRTGRFGLS